MEYFYHRIFQTFVKVEYNKPHIPIPPFNSYQLLARKIEIFDTLKLEDILTGFHKLILSLVSLIAL